LRRFRREHQLLEGGEFTPLRRGFRRPKFAKALDVFVGGDRPILEGRATEQSNLFRHPTDADTGGQATLGKHVDSREHLCRQNGMAMRQNHDRRQQPNTVGRRRNKAQGRDLFQWDTGVLREKFACLRVGIGAVYFRGDDHMIAHAEMFVAESFGFLGDGLQRIGVARHAPGAEM
jgi:hypothetical protein